jgi:hypothetical protein
VTGDIQIAAVGDLYYITDILPHEGESIPKRPQFLHRPLKRPAHEILGVFL